MTSLSVESTLLASVTYDPDRTLLELKFRDGGRYRFFDVPAPCVQQLLEATSKGAYFNRNIRNRFRFQQVAETDIEN